MKYLELLKLKSIQIAFIDPGIDESGICVYEHKRDVGVKFSRKILHCKHVVPIDNTGSLQQRSSEILDGIFFSEINDCRIIIVEQPPQTIYNSARMQKNALIGKAQNVMKLFFITGYIIAGLKNSKNLKAKVYTVIPKQWQPGKKQRGGVEDVKKWSIQHASELTPFCKAKIPSDMADAICMGDMILNKIESGIINFDI